MISWGRRSRSVRRDHRSDRRTGRGRRVHLPRCRRRGVLGEHLDTHRHPHQLRRRVRQFRRVGRDLGGRDHRTGRRVRGELCPRRGVRLPRHRRGLLVGHHDTHRHAHQLRRRGQRSLRLVGRDLGDGTTALIGAQRASSGAGAAYVFHVAGGEGSWSSTSTPTATLTDSAGAAGRPDGLLGRDLGLTELPLWSRMASELDAAPLRLPRCRGGLLVEHLDTNRYPHELRRVRRRPARRRGRDLGSTGPPRSLAQNSSRRITSSTSPGRGRGRTPQPRPRRSATRSPLAQSWPSRLTGQWLWSASRARTGIPAPWTCIRGPDRRRGPAPPRRRRRNQLRPCGGGRSPATRSRSRRMARPPWWAQRA